MITGSHNPKEYNGFKITIDKQPFFGSDIYALRDKFLKMQDFDIKDDTTCIKIAAKKRYIDYITKEFSHLKTLKTKIILDCGNGVAGTVIKDIFNQLELDYKALYLEPNGEFPNHHPDPTVEENLYDIKKELKKDFEIHHPDPTVEENLYDIKKELKKDFEIGFAYDGDADRIAVLTKTYKKPNCNR